MNGVHDMGGMDGFGPVESEAHEPVFHAPWEGRVYALTRAMGYARLWTTDESRATQERLPAHVYLSVSYYKRWTLGLERLLMKYGLVSADEIAAGRMLEQPKAPTRILRQNLVQATLSRQTFARPPQAPAMFNVGDQVRAKNMHPTGATRLPRYVRGHVGRIDRVHGCHVFPDSLVARKEEDPQWLYTVVFDGRELWGDDAEPLSAVSVDAFEPYLEPVGGRP